MYTAPRIENISSLVRNPNKYLGELAAGPIHFTQRGKEAGVMVSAAEWREIVGRLERLELLDEARRNLTAYQAGEMRGYSQEELDAAVAT